MHALRKMLFGAVMLVAPSVHAQEQDYQRPPEDMSIPLVHPLVGFDSPCPTPAGHILCAHKTYLGCSNGRNPVVCNKIGYNLTLAAKRIPEDDGSWSRMIFHRPWDMPLADLTQDFFEYTFVGLRLADEERLEGVNSNDRNRLLGTYEVMSRTTDLAAPVMSYKHSTFYRQIEDGSWRFAVSVSWTFGPPEVTRCNGDFACDSSIGGLRPW